MIPDLFSADDYIIHLTAALAEGSGRGGRAELARFLGCQASFVSQVLTRRAHLSREQSIKVADYLDLAGDERRFFMLLVDYQRAGTPQLRAFYREELDVIIRRREEVKERIAVAD